MVKICQTCGTQVIDDQSRFCTKCGAILHQDKYPLKTHGASFNYSKKFYGVIGLDLLGSFLLMLGGIGAYTDISNPGYKNVGFLVISLISCFNLLVDGILLSNIRKRPNVIDFRLCWIKCIFGFLGIITVISGIYFAIISLEIRNSMNKTLLQAQPNSGDTIQISKDDANKNMNQNIKPDKENIEELYESKNNQTPTNETNTSYNQVTPKEIDNQLNELRKFQNRLDLKKKEQIKSQIEAAKENVLKLQDSGNIPLIYNFITRYPNSNVSDQNFVNLKIVLAKKGIILTDLELIAVINGVKQEGELEWVKRRIFYNNPASSDECIKNYIEIFGKVNENVQKERLIDYFVKILKDNFNYQGNLASDLIRIEKQVELERFENSLTGQASGNRITINDIDGINGYDFEHVLKELFEKMGYRVIHTTLSNDQGADLIVEKFNVKTVIQAKHWQNNVTNSGIQEVVAAIKHYNVQKSMVISSSGFTQSARELARSNNVTLWDRSILAAMLDENPIFRNEKS
jgi:hypothetical protein